MLDLCALARNQARLVLSLLRLAFWAGHGQFRSIALSVPVVLEAPLFVKTILSALLIIYRIGTWKWLSGPLGSGGPES